MKKIFVLIVLSFIAIAGYSQITIKAEDISKHVGDRVKKAGSV